MIQIHQTYVPCVLASQRSPSKPNHLKEYVTKPNATNSSKQLARSAIPTEKSSTTQDGPKPASELAATKFKQVRRKIRAGPSIVDSPFPGQDPINTNPYKENWLMGPLQLDASSEEFQKILKEFLGDAWIHPNEVEREFAVLVRDRILLAIDSLKVDSPSKHPFLCHS